MCRRVLSKSSCRSLAKRSLDRSHALSYIFMVFFECSDASSINLPTLSCLMTDWTCRQTGKWSRLVENCRLVASLMLLVVLSIVARRSCRTTWLRQMLAVSCVWGSRSWPPWIHQCSLLGLMKMASWSFLCGQMTQPLSRHRLGTFVCTWCMFGGEWRLRCGAWLVRLLDASFGAAWSHLSRLAFPPGKANRDKWNDKWQMKELMKLCRSKWSNKRTL